ncbi:MAG: radical SAM protein [Archangiaceae bacterium]|nr:radical SAM protein [Archangiaceae bacterium]
MRAARVVTNQTCNQNCTYCDRRAAVEDPAFARGPAVVARIDAALEGGAAELTLTGGEPTLRADLVELVRRASSRGAKVVLETNAARVTVPLAAALREAGLSVARVNLAAADARLDAVTRDEGGFEASWRGVQALACAGVTVELQAAVVRSTLPLLEGLPALAHDVHPERSDERSEARSRMGAAAPETHGAAYSRHQAAEQAHPYDGVSALQPSASDGRAHPDRVQALVLGIPVQGPDATELLPLDVAARAIERVEALARPMGLATRLSADAWAPPCLFSARVAHLFSLTPGGAERAGFARLPGCSGCEAADRCPGFPTAAVERFGVPPHTTIRDPRVRRKLSLISTVEEQIGRELIEPSHGPEGEEAIVRINFHCNQACEFCFVSTHLPPADEARIERAIRDAAARGAKLVISGGEPTLNPRAVEWVRLARALSGKPVMLQTNAIRLDDAKLAEALVDAGVGEAFVSLHADTAALSDAITSAPGTFARTVRGLDNLARTPATVVVNHVICEANHARLPQFVEYVAERWPRALLNLSFIAPMTDMVANQARLIPRYGAVRPHLEAALELAQSRGVRVVGFQSMCGLPLCQVPPRARAQLQLSPVDEKLSRGEFVKGEVCGRCSLSDRCYGLRRRYADLHGTAELEAVV